MLQEVTVTSVIESPELLEIGRRAIEKELISRRNNRVSLFNVANGLVILEPTGQASDIIRISTSEALLIALNAIENTL